MICNFAQIKLIALFLEYYKWSVSICVHQTHLDPFETFFFEMH